MCSRLIHLADLIRIIHKFSRSGMFLWIHKLTVIHSLHCNAIYDISYCTALYWAYSNLYLWFNVAAHDLQWIVFMADSSLMWYVGSFRINSWNGKRQLYHHHKCWRLLGCHYCLWTYNASDKVVSQLKGLSLLIFEAVMSLLNSFFIEYFPWYRQILL